MYTVASTGTTWLPLEEVVDALGLDNSHQAQELAEAYALTVGSDPKTGVTSVLIPSKVRPRPCNRPKARCMAPTPCRIAWMYHQEVEYGSDVQLCGCRVHGLRRQSGRRGGARLSSAPRLPAAWSRSVSGAWMAAWPRRPLGRSRRRVSPMRCETVRVWGIDQARQGVISDLFCCEHAAALGFTSRCICGSLICSERSTAAVHLGAVTVTGFCSLHAKLNAAAVGNR